MSRLKVRLSLVRQCILLDVSRAFFLSRLQEDEGLAATFMGLEAIYPNTSKPAPGHRIFPYLLKGVEVNRVDQVWAADITYIPMAKGFLYLVAIMDWHSRHVLAWKLSNTMDTSFCVAALEEALGKGRPQVSMDGKGRYLDNIFVERLWRSGFGGHDFEPFLQLKYSTLCRDAQVEYGRFLDFDVEDGRRLRDAFR